MGVSKVDFGRTTLIDLTEDSVDAASLLRGKTAHNRAGDKVDGTLDVVSVHKKQNGVWSTIDKSSIDQTKKYKLIQ